MSKIPEGFDANERRCFEAGWLAAKIEAVALVRDHWNDSRTMVNQKEQALRSANAIDNCMSIETA